MGANVVASWQKVVKLLQDCSTRQTDSAAEAALQSVHKLTCQLEKFPTPPKAVWKKLVQQLQVPLHLGAAFTAAAQQHFKSPIAQKAMFALSTLLWHACDAGIASNTASIQQQLQQSGMQQQLPAVLAAMTAELQAEIAVLAAGGWDAADTSGDPLGQFCGDGALQSQFSTALASGFLLWEFWETVGLSATDWVWGPGGLADMVMQFTTAALQHVSSVAQHVLPAVRKRLPQLAEALERRLQCTSQLAWMLCMQMPSTSVIQSLQKQQRHSSDAGTWQQQLLLSPHLLPCVATVVVIVASHLDRYLGAHRAGLEGSSDGRSSSSSKEADSSGAVQQPQQQQQSTSNDSSNNNNNNSSRSSGGVDGTLAASQLQLLQLLGLAPELIDWVLQRFDLNASFSQLSKAVGACHECCVASWLRLRSSGTGSGERWMYEQQLWRLLPTVLLPCASSLLLPMPASALQQIEGVTEVLVAQLLELSSKVVQLSAELHMHLQDPVIPCTALPAAGVEELLDVLLQLADRLLYQQPPSQTAATSSSSTSSSSSSTCSSLPVVRSLCAGQLLPLLLETACDSHDNYSGRNQCGTFHSPAAANCSNSEVGVPLLATKFVGFVTAIHATVRAVSAALQSGAISATKDPQYAVATFVGSLSRSMLLPDTKQPYLLQHMGLCGPAALAQEQQQLYSLLSTLQKLRWCVWAEDPLRSQTLTASCCLAAGHAAVELLKMTLSAGAGGSAAPSQQPQPSTAAAAAAQQPAVSYLPSLVIFGRCLLQWAEQLQQQEPDLLLEAGDLQQTTQGLLYHSAARVCIPGLRQGSAIKPGERLESLAATVSEWVSGLDCESTQAQLRAAGCSPEQLQQQLDALLSAQQGTQQGLTDASFAALVQQLQATGAMLGSIAVPHFCNNPACANLSGPTDVRLVSGRSCICAGCRIARYCGRTCQRAAWKQHKPVCKELAAAAATAATAEGS